MKKLAYLPFALFAGLVFTSISARADVIRVTVNEFKSNAGYQQYIQGRAQINKYVKARPGFVSVTWFSDPKSLMAGATTVFKTRQDEEATYNAPAYKALNKKNVAPDIKKRTVHIFNIDQMQ